jgi:hypothetical protein
MKNKIILLVLFCFSFAIANAQDFVFTMEVSGDSLLLGNYLEISYTIENAQGKFEPPSFEGLDIVSGPNYSSSIAINNGEMTSKESYSYWLMPKDIGLYTIDPAYFLKDGETFESKPLEIVVLPNPDGIKTNPQRKIFKDSFGTEGIKPELKPKKKKRKLKKI